MIKPEYRNHCVLLQTVLLAECRHHLHNTKG